MNTTILEYGASTGSANNAEAIQKAIDAVHESGGGRVVIPPGEFQTGGITLRSGVCLALEEGAHLKGSPHLADYAPHRIPHFTNPEPRRFHTALIYAEEAEDIAIEGPGMIDGNGGAEKFRSYPLHDGTGGWHKPPRPWGIRLWKCRTVRLEGYRIESTAEWAHHICDCEGVAVHGITVFNHANANNDGLDFDGCRDVLVTDCVIDADDDALCFKSTGFRTNRNIRVRGCRLASRCRVIHCGSESSGLFEDIVVEDCAIVKSRATQKIDVNRSDEAAHAIQIENIDGAVMRNLTFRNITVEGCLRGIRVDLDLRSTQQSKYPGHTFAVGSIDGVTFSNIRGTCSASTDPSLNTASGHQIANLRSENVALRIG